MLERILEPEYMDSASDAAEYDAMDFTDVNASFADAVTTIAGNDAYILDLGTGTGRIPIMIAQRMPNVRIVAVDMASHMLTLGRQHVEQAGLTDRITLTRMDAKQLDCPTSHFDLVISNSLIHHIPSPLDTFREIARVMRPNAGLLIQDLFRPATTDELNGLVETYAADCNDYQRRLFTESLHAALTVDEVRRMITEVGLDGVDVQACSDRHWKASRVAKPAD